MAMLWNGIAMTPACISQVTIPAAPSALTANAITHDQINLSWTDNANNEDGFKVERSPDDIAWAQIDTTIADDTHYWDTGRDENTQYYYRVRAYNAIGDSAYSNTADDTTPDFTLEDQFTTNEGAPIASPRTCEPGAGELVRTDGGNRMSIASQELTMSGGSGSWGDPGFYMRNDDDSGLGRGYYFEFEFSVTTSGYLMLGWSNNTSLALANLKHTLFTYISAARAWQVRDTGSVATTATMEYVAEFDLNTTYTVRIYTIAGGGALWMVKGGHWGSDFRPLAYSLNQSDATVYPAYLDQTAANTIDDARVVQATPPDLYVAYYNGRWGTGADDAYRIGRCVSDEIACGPQVENYVMDLGAGGAWDDEDIKDMYVLKDGATYKMWYGGYGGANWQIGYATSADGISWAKSGSNPVLTPGAGGAWDDAGVTWPVVYKDAGAVAAKRWKMLYSGYDGANWQIGYAYSADGISWNKGGSNPVVANGGVGTFDELVCNAGALIKDGATYYLFYEGRENNVFPSPSKMGLATFTDFEGAYTKSGNNPLLERRNANQALTANLAQYGTSVSVGDSSGFVVDEVVLITDTSVLGHQARITAIPNGTTINFEPGAHAAFTMANNSRIMSTVRSFTPRSMFIENGLWHCVTSAYGGGVSSNWFESSYYATSTNSDSGWSWDHANSPPLWLPVNGKYNLTVLNWAARSAENLMFVLDAGTMARVTL